MGQSHCDLGYSEVNQAGIEHWCVLHLVSSSETKQPILLDIYAYGVESAVFSQEVRYEVIAGYVHDFDAFEGGYSLA